MLNSAIATLLVLYAALSPIRLAVYPKVVGVRGTVRVRLAVERNADNRRAVLIVDNQTTYYRYSEYQLDGEASPVTQPDRFFDQLPGGEYDVKAALYTNASDKPKTVTFDRFTVVGEF